MPDRYNYIVILIGGSAGWSTAYRFSSDTSANAAEIAFNLSGYTDWEEVIVTCEGSSTVDRFAIKPPVRVDRQFVNMRGK